MTTATAPSPSPTNFFSSGLCQKVDQLMDILWSGGVNNPATSIEQISYLLFLRLLTERDEQKARIAGKSYKRIFSGKWARFSWNNFVTLTGNQLFTAVREAIESLHELPDLTDTGKLLFQRATLKIFDIPSLKAVINTIHSLDLAEHDGLDLKGDMYEYLLSRLAVSGTNGQFRTPRHIIDMIVKLVDPQPHHRICDPACGTAGFLISAYTHILKKTHGTGRKNFPGGNLTPKQWEFLHDESFTGYDNDADMVKIAIMNLYLHRLEKAKVDHFNPLTTSFAQLGGSGQYPGQTYDIILANPPFSGSIQKESILADINLPTRDTELLFMKWFIDHLNPGGKAGVIVPAGVLFGSTKGAKKVRELLLTECQLHAVIAMPSGIFKPYSGVSTAALIFQKRTAVVPTPSSADSVWFYEMTADGFSLDDKRNEIPANDIPDILARSPDHEESPNSWRVPFSKIIENDYALAAGRYKPTTVEAVSHDKPANILSEVLKLENEIAIQARNLLGEIAK
ncbi:MAG TPA: class I SAM-dependent DNA methyltransferase [Phycisphaerae bacterium]|nr:class I SAM-dependent DNA methyltransferase [Phycisphaerae bacterium]